MAPCVCRREEVSGEAQRALRCFATKSSEKEGSKPMPSFPDMVAYVQDKVKLFLCLSLHLRQPRLQSRSVSER